MIISPDLSTLTIVTATALEARAVRRAVPGARVVEAGLGLSRLRRNELGEVVVSCGLAGALQSSLRTGSVVVPESVATPSGETVSCDAELVEALVAAARRLGHEPERGPLLTSEALVTGAARETWAQRGYVAVDMETGLIRARRVAAVRVILDTPERELSDAWLRPSSALVRPKLWPQALWLWREAPRCARLAAAVIGAAFS